jgi:hypothetical protein
MLPWGKFAGIFCIDQACCGLVVILGIETLDDEILPDCRFGLDILLKGKTPLGNFMVDKFADDRFGGLTHKTGGSS